MVHCGGAHSCPAACRRQAVVLTVRVEGRWNVLHRRAQAWMHRRHRTSACRRGAALARRFCCLIWRGSQSRLARGRLSWTGRCEWQHPGRQHRRPHVRPQLAPMPDAKLHERHTRLYMCRNMFMQQWSAVSVPYASGNGCLPRGTHIWTLRFTSFMASPVADACLCQLVLSRFGRHASAAAQWT